MINYTNIYDVISDYVFVLRGFKRNKVVWSKTKVLILSV